MSYSEQRVPAAKVIIQFYAAYSRWLDEGAISDEFSTHDGLCANLFDFCTINKFDNQAALNELHRSFESEGLRGWLPFNPSNDHFLDEVYRHACHLNPARVSWVKSHLAGESGGGVA